MQCVYVPNTSSTYFVMHFYLYEGMLKATN